ncbi:MAG: LON peptidase substrate-binding domain-containing protein, partial [Candidatus Hydrogenedentes bacterium]|nr:LON peptidase substrate-binding domain-containing protein [Candidatus Hydrogenedentota bacterium]
MPRKKKIPVASVFTLPLLPLKDAVVFPKMVLPLFVGRPGSVAAVEHTLDDGNLIFLCAQHDPNEEEPKSADMFRVGTVAKIVNVLRLPDNSLKVVVEGLGRVTVKSFKFSTLPCTAKVQKVEVRRCTGKAIEGLQRVVLRQFEDYMRLTGRIAPEVFMSIQSISDPEVFTDTICAFLFIPVKERQELLEQIDAIKRLKRISEILIRENELAEIEQEVRAHIREQVERGQREHYLQEQLRVIQQE